MTSTSSDSDDSHAHKRHKKHHKDHKKKSDKEKKHRHKDKKHKHKHHRHHHREASESIAAPEASESIAAPAWAPFAAVVAANPSSRADLRALLEMLDAGQVVVLEQVEDTSLRSKLQAALEALGLPAETLPDGSIAHAKPDGMDASLAAQFSTVLDDDDAAVGSAADGSAADREEEEEAEEAPEAPSSKRVYGVAGPPPSRSIGPSSGPPSGGDSIGPAMPPVADKDEQEDEDADEEDGIGPALPPPPGADGDAFGALASGKSGGDRRLWWQQEQSAPKPTAPIPEDGGVATTVGQTERDDWMVALPTERTSLNTQGQARQFSRNGVQAAGDLSIWTDAPAEREKKAKAAEARSWGAVGMPGGSGGGGGGGGGEPMTLAEAVALARENAASGKRPRGFETGGNGGGGGGGGGAADDGPKAKSLVEIHAEQAASEKKAKKGKADWEGKHPWKPWNRETDLDIRAANPKGKESILNNQHMGTLGDRFGSRGRDTTFM